MTVRRLDTYTLIYSGSDKTESYPSLESAMAAAERHVGNRSYAKPFPGENTYLYGFGDGETVIMVRQDVTFS